MPPVLPPVGNFWMTWRNHRLNGCVSPVLPSYKRDRKALLRPLAQASLRHDEDRR